MSRFLRSARFVSFSNEDILHVYVALFYAAACAQLEQQAVEAAAEERHHAELQHAYKELLHMEDWSGASRDRFLGVRSNTAFEQRLKQASREKSDWPGRSPACLYCTYQTGL